MILRNLIQRLTAIILASLPMSVPVANAAPFAIDPANPANGLTDIFSTTLDGGVVPCGPGAPPYFCSFFIGSPQPTRFITIIPNPTGVANLVPGGIAGAVSGSFLDLELNPGNTQVTIRGGTLAFQTGFALDLGGTTLVTPGGVAGIVINSAPQVVSVDANGVAEFLVDLFPTLAADFSLFTDIVAPPYDGTGTECTGTQCNLVPLLTLDMFRYRLLIDFDPTFTSFTADFIGQTGNESMLFATFNSVVPDIEVTDSVAPADDLSVPFGTVTEMAFADQTLTITNAGTGDLVLGNLAQADPLAAPFSVANDACSGQTLMPAENCLVTLRFAPGSSGMFSDSLDIPSNDPVDPTITVDVSGTGTVIPVPDITVTDSVVPIDDLQIPFGSIGLAAVNDQTVTVTNDGTADLVLGLVAMADPLLLPFSILNDTCSMQTLMPAANCTFTVRFEPTMVGDFTDGLDIPSNDPDEPTVDMSVTGTGSGAAMPNISVTDSVDPIDDRQLPFGDVWETFSANQSVTVTNDGNADLVIGMISAPAAPFSVVADGCSGQTLAPTMTCSVNLRFSPDTTGTFGDVIDIPSNDPDEATVTVGLSGAGIPAQVGEKLPLKPTGSDGGFFGASMDIRTLLALLLLGAAIQARRHRRCAK